MLYCKHISISEKESEKLCTLRLSKINKLLIHLLLKYMTISSAITNCFNQKYLYLSNVFFLIHSSLFCLLSPCHFVETRKNKNEGIVATFSINLSEPTKINWKLLKSAMIIGIFEFKTCTFASLPIYTTEKWELSSCNCKLFNCVNNMIYITAFHNEWIN